MKLDNSAKLHNLVVSLVILSLFCLSAEAQTTTIPARITQAVDEKNLVVLHGNVRPLARPEFDQGAVSDAQPLRRMLLLLQRSPDQEAALEKLLDAQQSKASPNYHSWLTPAQFGRQFGPSDEDIQTVTSWLQSHGFQVSNVTAGRTIIEFSGNAGQVRNAFHTEIHNYLIDGESHTANVSDPQIPAALAPVVVGPVSLNNFPIPSHMRRLGTFQRPKNTTLAKPLFTFPGCTPSGCFALGPADFATVYNSAPLLSGTPKIDGTGQTIAIVGESDIDPTDVTDFQTMFGMTPNFSASNIIVNGADPGVNGSEGESDLDVQWASAVAPGATIKFVTSEPTEATAGIFLSAIYIVENNFAGVMSESFGACEQHIGTLNQFHNSLWQQAAAQGITVILSAGDGGSAGCDNFDTAQAANQGLAVSGFASTPYNIAVGGTDFDEANQWTNFWNTTNNSTNQASAKSYIPEIPWNDSCAQIGLNGCGASAPQGSLNIVAGSGGVSTLYAKPSWQSGTGVPLDGHRDLPDVSLFASNGFDGTFYIVCQKDRTGTGSCNLADFGFTFEGVGGTSASAPAFAGIMALVNQSLSTAQTPAPRQGNANYILYSLFNKQNNASPAINCSSSTSASSSCTFYDITHGNSDLPTRLPGIGTNSVPCLGGTSNCSSKVAGTNGVLVTTANPSTPAYSTTTGYDLATGLGSVNITNLVKNWSSVSSLASTTTLSATVNGQAVSSIVGISHGTPVNVSSSVAAGQGATGTPSGQVALIATPNPNAGTPGPSLGFDVLSLVSGTATSTSVILPGGQYNLTAHYQGDGTFGASDSTPGIPVNISAEPSKTLISIPTFNPTTGAEAGNTPTSLVYASAYIARIDVGNANATITFPPQSVCTPPACPTGTITWTDSLNGAPAVPLDGGSFQLNSAGYTEDQPINLTGGNHTLTASYSGDSSFAKSSSTYNITVAPAPTMTGSGNPPLPSQIVLPFGLGATVTSQNFGGVMESCNVTFLDGNTPVPGTVQCSGQNGGPTYGAFIQPSLIVNQTTAGTHTYTAKFDGDANYAPSSSAPMTTRVFYGTTVSISATATNIQYGSSITLTAIVDSIVPQGGPQISNLVTFYYGYGPTAVAGTVSYMPITDPSGNIALQATITVTPQSSGFFTATFAGDNNYFNGGTIIPINVTVNIPDFSLSANLPTSAIAAGSSATATITVTPASNSTSAVTLACPTNGMPMGISCGFTPTTVNLGNGAAATSTLTISTLAPSSSNSTSTAPLQIPPNQLPPRLFWPIPVASLLALFSLFLLPARLRRARLALGAALACCFLLFLGFAGCGGGGSTGVGGGGGGPVPSSITLTTSSVKVPFSPATGGVVNLTANVTSSKTPGGTVTFITDGGIGLGNNPVISGVAQLQLTGLSVGIHNITAKYSGDANTLSSQTNGGLNIAVTGQTAVSILANTGGLTHSINVNFSLQ